MPQPKVFRNRVETPEVAVEAAPSTLDDLTFDELYALAQERNIAGRSKLTRDGLIAALQGA